MSLEKWRSDFLYSYQATGVIGSFFGHKGQKQSLDDLWTALVLDEEFRTQFHTEICARGQSHAKRVHKLMADCSNEQPFPADMMGLGLLVATQVRIAQQGSVLNWLGGRYPSEEFGANEAHALELAELYELAGVPMSVKTGLDGLSKREQQRTH